MAYFNVYQIELTNADVAEINSAERPFDIPKYKAYVDSTLGKLTGFVDFYTLVGVIEANDLEHAFEVGNIGPEDAITRIEGKNMTSLSVGNVLEDQATGEQSMVAVFGFETDVVERV